MTSEHGGSRRAARVSTCDVADVVDGAMEIRGLQQVAGSGMMWGPAHTAEAPPGGGTDTVYEAVLSASPGEVVVVDFGGPDVGPAGVGDILAAEGVRRGLAGVVLWGRARDVGGLREVDLPVFATGVTPMTGRHLGVGKMQVPLSIGGVEVVPGATIVGDVNGVLVLPRDLDPASAWRESERVYELNARVRGRIEDGEPMMDVPEARSYRDAIYGDDHE